MRNKFNIKWKLNHYAGSSLSIFKNKKFNITLKHNFRFFFEAKKVVNSLLPKINNLQNPQNKIIPFKFSHVIFLASILFKMSSNFRIKSVVNIYFYPRRHTLKFRNNFWQNRILSLFKFINISLSTSCLPILAATFLNILKKEIIFEWNWLLLHIWCRIIKISFQFI